MSVFCMSMFQIHKLAVVIYPCACQRWSNRVCATVQQQICSVRGVYDSGPYHFLKQHIFSSSGEINDWNNTLTSSVYEAVTSLNSKWCSLSADWTRGRWDCVTEREVIFIGCHQTSEVRWGSRRDTARQMRLSLCSKSPLWRTHATHTHTHTLRLRQKGERQDKAGVRDTFPQRTEVTANQIVGWQMGIMKENVVCVLSPARRMVSDEGSWGFNMSPTIRDTLVSSSIPLMNSLQRGKWKWAIFQYAAGW